MQNTKLFLLLPAVFTACVDQEPIADEDLAETEQLSDNCVTGGNLNDELTVSSSVGSTDSYTRPGSTTCSTLQTKVKVHMSAAPVYTPPGQYCIAGNSIKVSVDNADWGIQSDGMTDDKTECENSSLVVTITDANGNNVGVYPSGTVHPKWVNGHCGGVDITAANAWGLSQNAGEYTVKVKAIRGLEQYDHGYARHTIVAKHDSSYTCL